MTWHRDIQNPEHNLFHMRDGDDGMMMMMMAN